MRNELLSFFNLILETKTSSLMFSLSLLVVTVAYYGTLKSEGQTTEMQSHLIYNKNEQPLGQPL